MRTRNQITVEDIYRVDRSAVERQLGHPIKTLAPWGDTYDDRRRGEPCACGRMVSHGHSWGKRCGTVLGCRFDQRPARQVVLFAQPDAEDCE